MCPCANAAGPCVATSHCPWQNFRHKYIHTYIYICIYMCTRARARHRRVQARTHAFSHTHVHSGIMVCLTVHSHIQHTRMHVHSLMCTHVHAGTLVCIAADAQATAHVKCAWQWLCASGLEVHITCANAYLQALLREVGGKGWVDIWPHRPCTSSQTMHVRQHGLTGRAHLHSPCTSFLVSGVYRP